MDFELSYIVVIGTGIDNKVVKFQFFLVGVGVVAFFQLQSTVKHA